MYPREASLIYPTLLTVQLLVTIQGLLTRLSRVLAACHAQHAHPAQNIRTTSRGTVLIRNSESEQALERRTGFSFERCPTVGEASFREGAHTEPSPGSTDQKKSGTPDSRPTRLAWEAHEAF